MKADILTLSAIFQPFRKYEVPLFQRPYVWNLVKQWEPLWEDVLRAEEAIASTGDARPHFLGAIVVQQVPTTVGSLDQRLVIDGQQRIITLQLLCNAVYDHAEKLGAQGVSDLMLTCTTNPPALVKSPEDRFKVWPTNSDREEFVRVLEERQSPKRPKGVGGAFRYFMDQIGDWLKGLEAEERVGALTRLNSAIQERMTLVVINLDERDDPQVIFETLNARGTPLSAGDLVKNTLFHRANSEGEDLQVLYDRDWRDLDSDEWRKEVRVGRLKIARLDAYLTHLLTMMRRAEVTHPKLYVSFRDHVEAGGLPVASIFQEIHRYSDVYSGFTAESAGRRGMFFRRLNEMQVTTAHPLLLHLLGSGRYSEADIDATLSILESYLVRRLVCKLTTKNYNRLFVDALVALEKGEGAAAVLVSTFLGTLGGESVVWPSDQDVDRALASVPLYRIMSQGRLRMILEGLDAHLQTNKTEYVEIKSALTIEHLMPQSWKEHWPLAPGVDVLEARDHREQAIHLLGNLTLVTGPLNSDASNGPWPKKRSAILENSKLVLNRGFPDSWDEAAIAERGRVLGAAFKTIWSRPPPPPE